MQIPKPTEADKERFRSLVPDDPRVTVKPMFGNLGAFVNGNMFMGLFGSDVGVRLPSDAAAELLAFDGAGPFGPSERPMGGYVTLPAVSLSDRSCDPWVERALEHAGSMKPKA
jgi:TfoX/Sxy family transcriptional regulator of competence genes